MLLEIGRLDYEVPYFLLFLSFMSLVEEQTVITGIFHYICLLYCNSINNDL